MEGVVRWGVCVRMCVRECVCVGDGVGEIGGGSRW